MIHAVVCYIQVPRTGRDQNRAKNKPQNHSHRAIPPHTELFPLCGKFGLWITSLWHYMPDTSREGRGGGVCPDCSGRGALAAQAQIPVPGTGFFVRP